MTARLHALLSSLLVLPSLVVMGQACSSSSSTSSGAHDDAGNENDDAGSGGGNGRIVNACSDCSAGELCVDEVFTDGPCDGSGSGSDGEECSEGTMQTGGCCQENDSDTYYCFSSPTGCASPVTCECAADVVINACDGDDLDSVSCSQITGGLSCVQNHD